MMEICQVVATGRILGTPEMRPSGTGKVLSFDIRNTRTVKKADGSPAVETLVIPISVYGPLAQSTYPLLAEGTEVLVDGDLELQVWADETTCVKQSYLAIRARQVARIENTDQGVTGSP